MEIKLNKCCDFMNEQLQLTVVDDFSFITAYCLNCKFSVVVLYGEHNCNSFQGMASTWNRQVKGLKSKLVKVKGVENE